ncbi:ROK family transcriptional regulator [Goodfellowiella coeruleoviolacea]|uniref:Sugar kinase of the NBD/HSP70 family, may containing an N-terminal HTH domain n=1 Tax=Goodfellowiella coeruleoviolacea TaxID=334858 RepID=A0AAE3GCA1_9PSEU|nr:ROK family protein [Goodfellowiella coeruleoviolacea]MCP2164754.1 Sugar kinase of the NBD/HSP70 family, may containing an N-terminal HTH domain [Goodfellowiella coeruleoviolacea]
MRAGSPRLLREINDRAAIEMLLRHGPLTRAELESLIGLSKPATAQLLTRLENSNTVLRAGLRGGARGPRSQLWTVNGALAHVAGVDLTPQAVDVAIADITGAVLTEHHAAMPKGGNTAEVLRAFVDAVRTAAGQAGLDLDALHHVVVGSPGAVDPATGKLGFAPHLPGWEGFDLPGRLRDLLGAPVTVENDVNLVALEEMIAGRAQHVRDFVLVWPADAVGAAVVINRVVLRGATGGAGEIDGMFVPDRARADTGTDRAGTRFGDLLSSAAISKLARAHGLSARTGYGAVRRALTDGVAGREFLGDLARRIATGIAGMVSVLDPELVLLSGEISHAGGSLLCDLVAAELRRLVVPRTPVELSLVTGKAVRSGALRSGLSVLREQVFGLPADQHLPPPPPTTGTATTGTATTSMPTTGMPTTGTASTGTASTGPTGAGPSGADTDVPPPPNGESPH